MTRAPTEMELRVSTRLAEFRGFHGLGHAKRYLSRARAVIQVMREPTSYMLEKAGPMEGFDCDAHEADVDRPHKEWWSTMIDAASPE